MGDGGRLVALGEGRDPALMPTHAPFIETAPPQGQPLTCSRCGAHIVVWYRGPARVPIDLNEEVIPVDVIGEEAVTVWLADGLLTRLRRCPGSRLMAREPHFCGEPEEGP